MKRQRKLQVMILAVGVLVWLINFLWTRKHQSPLSAESQHYETFSSFRDSLMAELDETDLFEKGYVALLVGWAVLHSTGKPTVTELIDAVVDNELPSLAVMYADDQKHLYDWLPRDVAKLEVTKNPENFKLWQMVQPKNCKEILPLYLNTKTGSFICGDSSNSNIELWRRGLPHLPFSPFTGPALALDPEVWTDRQWVKYIFQGVTR